MSGKTEQRALPELNGRQRRILRFVIDQFARSFHPVGSRTLSKLSDEHLSAASIRNTMSDLEELGLLEQPHTSAGRVPSDMGYRYYVDQLMEQPLIPLAEQAEIESFFRSYRGAMGSVLSHASRLLSHYSHYIGIVSPPHFESVVLRHIQFVDQGSGTVLMIFISKAGLVYNKLLNLDQEVHQEELDKASRWINDEFEGLNLSQMRDKLAELLTSERARYDDLVKLALKATRAGVEEPLGEEQQVYIEGTRNLLREQSFSNRDKLESVLEAIEQKSTILDLISGALESDEVHVVIGSESELSQVKNCSIVAGTYTFPDGSRGNMAVLGPTNMLYPRSIYLVDFLGKQISTIIRT